jgi:short-subunit dehydrogenase involved in D-alanine esterification of teichoic acids
MEKMSENNNKIFSKVQVFQFLITFFITAFGILTAYYTTIAGIRLDLARKAESQFVNELDKRLSNLELLLNQNFMSKKEFFEMKEQINQRLLKIEIKLEGQK